MDVDSVGLPGFASSGSTKSTKDQSWRNQTCRQKKGSPVQTSLAGVMSASLPWAGTRIRTEQEQVHTLLTVGHTLCYLPAKVRSTYRPT